MVLRLEESFTFFCYEECDTMWPVVIGVVSIQQWAVTMTCSILAFVFVFVCSLKKNINIGQIVKLKLSQSLITNYEKPNKMSKYLPTRKSSRNYPSWSTAISESSDSDYENEASLEDNRLKQTRNFLKPIKKVLCHSKTNSTKESASQRGKGKVKELKKLNEDGEIWDEFDPKILSAAGENINSKSANESGWGIME
jgi:membrane-associated HD superfamily phosphohydrolase